MKKSTATVLFILVAGAASGAAASASISNEQPLVDAGLDQTVSVEETVLLDGGGSRDPDGEVVSFRWEITAPDGAFAVPDCPTCERTAFDPSQTGVYVVNLTVTDDDGASHWDELFVTVEGVDGPSVALDGPDSTTAGNQARYDASVDAGQAKLDETIWRIDGTVVQRDDLAGRHSEPKLRWTFDDPGQYEVSVTAVDEAGREASDDLDVSVESDATNTNVGTNSDPVNEEPTVTIEGPDVVDHGDYEGFTAVANDPDGVIVDYEWSNAESSVMPKRNRAGHHFTETPDSWAVISATVEDNGGATATARKRVRVNDTADPEVTIEAPEKVESCKDSSVELTANARNFDGQVSDYTWSGVDSSNWKWSSVTANGSEEDEVVVDVKAEGFSGDVATNSTSFRVKCESVPWEVESISFNAYTSDGNDVKSSDAKVEYGADGLPKSEDTLKFKASASHQNSSTLEFRFTYADGYTTTVTKSMSNSDQVTAKSRYSFDLENKMEHTTWGDPGYTETAEVVVEDEYGNIETATIDITWVNAHEDDYTYDIVINQQTDDIEEGERAAFDVNLDGPYDGEVDVDFGDGGAESVNINTNPSGSGWAAGSGSRSTSKRIHYTYDDANGYVVTAAPQTDQARGSGDTIQVNVAEETLSNEEQRISSHQGYGDSSGSSNSGDTDDDTTSSNSGSSSTGHSNHGYTRPSDGGDDADSSTSNDDSSSSSDSARYTRLDRYINNYDSGSSSSGYFNPKSYL